MSPYVEPDTIELSVIGFGEDDTLEIPKIQVLKPLPVNEDELFQPLPEIPQIPEEIFKPKAKHKPKHKKETNTGRNFLLALTGLVAVLFCVAYIPWGSLFQSRPSTSHSDIPSSIVTRRPPMPKPSTSIVPDPSHKVVIVTPTHRSVIVPPVKPATPPTAVTVPSTVQPSPTPSHIQKTTPPPSRPTPTPTPTPKPTETVPKDPPSETPTETPTKPPVSNSPTPQPSESEPASTPPTTQGDTTNGTETGTETNNGIIENGNQ